MDKETGGFNFGQVAPIIGPALGAAYSIFGPSRDTLRREQLEDQQKFTDMQANANKEQASYTAGLQKDMWDYTNLENQVAHAQNAGLNPGLLYGKGGAGGTTGSASAGPVSGGQAPSSAATRQNEMGMGMMIAQMGNLVAQTEKTKAETENLKAQTGKTGVETEIGKIDQYVKEQTKNETMDTIIAGASKAISEAGIASQNKEIQTKTLEDQIKTIQQNAIQSILKNEGTTTENKIKTAVLAIEQFEAESAKKGISTKSPWYIKMMGKLYDEVELYLNK